MVSHDRYLLNQVCERLLVLSAARIESVSDSYDRWRARQGEERTKGDADRRLLLEVRLAEVAARLGQQAIHPADQSALRAEFFPCGTN